VNESCVSVVNSGFDRRVIASVAIVAASSKLSCATSILLASSVSVFETTFA